MFLNFNQLPMLAARRVVTGLVIAGYLFSISVEAKEVVFYAAPATNGVWFGSSPRPFTDGGKVGGLPAVIEAARAARSKLGPDSQATIYLRGGTYESSAPLVLTPEDSGLTIAAYRKEKPVISGGRKIMFRDGEAGVLDPESGFAWLPLEEEIVFDNTLFIPPVGSKNRAVQGELGLTFRPAPPLRIDHTFLYERLSTRAHALVFADRILREKVNYQFTRELSLRAIVDYALVTRDSTRSRVDPEHRWSIDLLLTYLVNPGTALYLGFRDGYENLAILPGTPPALYRTEDPTTPVGRQLFLKLSYLMQF